MQWDDYKIEFVTDQLLLDIYVFETTISDWQTLLDFVRSGPNRVSYTVDRDETVLPQSVADIFHTHSEVSLGLAIYLDTVRINAHFFLVEQIELDIQADEIQCETEAEAVFDFVRQISRLLNKEVSLTSESAEDDVIFQFSPNGAMQYFPALSQNAQSVRGRFPT